MYVVWWCWSAGIGGSGRQSATKLAANMCGSALFQIEITKHYTTVEWRDDIKKVDNSYNLIPLTQCYLLLLSIIRSVRHITYLPDNFWGYAVNILKTQMPHNQFGNRSLTTGSQSRVETVCLHAFGNLTFVSVTIQYNIALLRFGSQRLDYTQTINTLMHTMQIEIKLK